MAQRDATSQPLRIHIVYAQANSVWQKTLTLPAGATVQFALMRSGFFEAFPEWTPETVAVGIYGKRCQLPHVLHDQDRIEIYRPLVYDPMESRRRRARHKSRKK